MIGRLPRDSAYGEALADDDTLAEYALAQRETVPTRRMADWSVQVELLTDLRDLLGELITATIAAQGVKTGTLPRAPRPYTAVDRLRKQRRQSRHRALVSRMLPNSST